MTTTLECPLSVIQEANSDQAECLIEVFESKSMADILRHVASMGPDEEGRRSVELLCKKCPVVVMGRIITSNSFECRAIDTDLCAEGKGDPLFANWETCKL